MSHASLLVCLLLPPVALPANFRTLTTAIPRHPGKTIAVTYSPDGKYLASGGWDRFIRIWNADTGAAVAAWEAHDPAVWALTYSTEGTQLLSSGRDGKVALWDVAAQEEIQRFDGHTAGVYKFVWLQREGRLLTASFDKSVREWDVRTGREVRKLTLEAEVHGLTVAPDGKTFALATERGAVSIYDRFNNLVRIWDAHSTGIDHLAYAPDGKTLASGGWDSKAILWNAADGGKLHTLEHTAGVWPAVFSPDGKLVATGSNNGRIALWNTATGEKVRDLEGHTQGVPLVAFRPDGAVLASVAHDGTLRRWEVATGKSIGPEPSHLDRVRAVRFSAAGRELLSLGRERYLIAWNVANGSIARRHVLETRVLRQANLADRWAIVCDDDRTFEVIDAQGARVPFARAGHETPSFLDISSDGRYLAVMNRQSVCTVWERATGRMCFQTTGAESQPLAFAPDGATLAVGVRQGVIHLYRTSDGAMRRFFAPQNVALWRLGFSPDGRLLAAIAGTELVVWDVASGHVCWRIDVPTPDLALDRKSHTEDYPFAFSPDGRLLYVADIAGHLHGLDTLTGKTLVKLTAPDTRPTCLAVAPDSRSVAVGNADGTIRLWTVASPPWPLQVQTGEALRKHVADLGHAGGEPPRRALAGLLAGGADTVAVLRQSLQPVARLVPAQVARLLRQLDAEDYDEREAAQLALLGLGLRVEPDIDRALATAPTPEAKRRLREIQQELLSASLPAETLRAVRAVEVLERLGARAVLEALAQGDPEAETTRQARAALGRLR